MDEYESWLELQASKKFTASESNQKDDNYCPHCGATVIHTPTINSTL